MGSPDMDMAVATLSSTRAVLTTTDPMATTSTTPTARGLLSLVMDMDIMEALPATSTSPAPTLTTELESPTPTENEAPNHTFKNCQIEIVPSSTLLLYFVKQNCIK